MRTDITKINEKTPHQDLTEGLMVFAGGTSKLFNTGEWRTNTPVYVADKCKQCLLCTPTCPDGCIPVVDGKRLAFDMDHCKGCGICANVCPFGAIEMKEAKGSGRSKNVCQVTRRFPMRSVKSTRMLCRLSQSRHPRRFRRWYLLILRMGKWIQSLFR